MSQFGSVKARPLRRALLKPGWSIKRETGGSHKVLAREGWPDFVFAFHDSVEVGPKMMPPVAKRTGLTPDNL